MRILTILAALIVACLANLAFWYLPNRPVPLEPPPGGKLQSVSFAPYRDGQSPLTKSYPSPEQIDEDLRVLAAQVAGVRTYTSQEGMDVVPELARRHGLTVTMGAWLSSKLDRNEGEVESLIALANRYPDTITRVIVGNEVLLRGELTPDQLAGYIRRVKAAIKQPVSYADVWEWWLKYPQMAKEVDFLTIHLLPYWEDIPAGVEDATEHIGWSYREIARRFPDKPILVGETGWPTAGRTRGPAAPGLVNKALFVNRFVRLAAEEGFDYNIIEAFDQNWKQRLEGTVGGHWGLYTVDRTPKFSLAGPVVENPRWREHFALSAVAGLALLALFSAGRTPLPASGVAAMAVLTQAFSAAWLQAVERALHWAYYWYDVTQAAVMLTLAALIGLVMLAACRRTLAGGRLDTEPLRRLSDDVGLHRPERLGALFLATLGIIAVAWSFLIVFDGRYRNFPVTEYAVPVLGVAALGLFRLLRRPAGTGWAGALAAGTLFRPTAAVTRGAVARPRLESWLARGLLAGAVLTVLAEGLLPVDAPLRGWLRGSSAAPLSAIDWTGFNLQALVWALEQVVLALPFAASARLAARSALARDTIAGPVEYGRATP